MIPITSVVVANSILLKSFSYEEFITFDKLNRLLYILYCEYYKETNTLLFSEDYEVIESVPVFPYVYYKFSGCGNDYIKKFSRDALGKVYVINSNLYSNILDRVWIRFKNWNIDELDQYINNMYEVKKLIMVKKEG